MKLKIKHLGKYYEFEEVDEKTLLDSVKIPAKGGAVVEFTKNGETKTKVLNSLVVRGLFGVVSGSAKELALKRFNQLFN